MTKYQKRADTEATGKLQTATTEDIAPEDIVMPGSSSHLPAVEGSAEAMVGAVEAAVQVKLDDLMKGKVLSFWPFSWDLHATDTNAPILNGLAAILKEAPQLAIP